MQAEGIICTTLDMTSIGSENITALQWYKGILFELVRSLKLFGKVNLKKWWQEKEAEQISFLQRFNHFICEVILEQFPEQNIVIFIDEIDSILSLDFSVDDFFALIRFCYNQRAIEPKYKRITFAIFGVATPSDLIVDKTRTPFNIGKEIKLNGFTLEEAKPLAEGLKIKIGNRREILKQIIKWTNGQPFLTQKLCQLALNLSQNSVSKSLSILPGSEEFWVDSIVKKEILTDWESQDKPEHLKTIRDRIICDSDRAGRILAIYQKILQGQTIRIEDSREQIELVLSGLIIKNKDRLEIKNKIYSEIFNLKWVEKQLNNLRPYSQTLDKWLTSQKTDESRLLRGKALKDARLWANGKSLSDLDHQFLAASFELEQKEIQKSLKAQKAKAIEVILFEEQKNVKLQRLLLIAVSLALAIASSLGTIVYWQYCKAKEIQKQALKREKEARISQIKLLITSSLKSSESGDKLDGLIQAIAAIERIEKNSDLIDSSLKKHARDTLRQIIYTTNEYNRLSAHTTEVNEVVWHEATQKIYSAGSDGTIKIWQPNGKLIKTIVAHKTEIKALSVSENGAIIATGSEDKEIKLWRSDGTLINTIRGHQGIVNSLAIASDNQIIISASDDRTIKIWHREGKLLHTLTGHQNNVNAVAITRNGELIVSGSADGTIKYWQPDGTLIKTIENDRQKPITDLTIARDGQTIVSGSSDDKIKLWRRDGTLITTLKGHKSAIKGVAISNDGQLIASTSKDNKIKLWRANGIKIKSIEVNSHHLTQGIAFSPDGRSIASASFNGTIKLWQINNNNRLLTTIYPHEENIRGIVWSPDGKYIASASNDGTIEITKLDKTSLATLVGHEDLVRDVAWSSNGKYIASASEDGTVKLWQPDSTLWRTLTLEAIGFRKVAFSPDSKYIAAASEDSTVKLWRVRDGALIRTFIGHTNRVFNLVFSPDGRYIASASLDGTVRLWGRDDGKLIRIFRGHRSEVYGIDYSPDGKYIVSSSADRTIKLWQVDGTLIQTFTGHQGIVRRVAFSPDGRTIASAGEDKMIKLWRDGKLLITLNGHNRGIRTIAWHPDGKIVASAGRDESIIIWHLENILNLNELEYACNWVRDYLNTNPEVKDDYPNICDR